MTRGRPPAVACYVSGHGFGHAVRTTAWLAALRARLGPEAKLLVRSDAPTWIFTGRDPALRCEPAHVDVGALQPNGLDVDLPATLAAHEAFVAGWAAALEREAAWLRQVGARLVVADVPPLACAAAAHAGLPALAVANFSWDWILEGWADGEPRFRAIAARYAEAYGQAEQLYRLPLHGAMPAFRRVVDVPLLVHRSRADPARTRRALGLAEDERRRLVLVSFGGFGSGALGRTRWDDLSDFCFVGFGPPPPGLPARWIELPERSPLPHEDLVAACDAVLGKPGYGTCAEVLAHRVRFLHLPRVDFREVTVLEEGLARHGCARQMPREDFLRGRWGTHLEALFAAPAQPAPPPADGDAVIADAVLERL